MTITELAAHDAADRARIHANAIAQTRRAIETQRARHAPTDALERCLARLEGRAS